MSQTPELTVDYTRQVFLSSLWKNLEWYSSSSLLICQGLRFFSVFLLCYPIVQDGSSQLAWGKEGPGSILQGHSTDVLHILLVPAYTGQNVVTLTQLQGGLKLWFSF